MMEIHSPGSKFLLFFLLPSTEFELEVACEETDRFILSVANMEKVAR